MRAPCCLSVCLSVYSPLFFVRRLTRLPYIVCVCVYPLNFFRSLCGPCCIRGNWVISSSQNFLFKTRYVSWKEGWLYRTESLRSWHSLCWSRNSSHLTKPRFYTMSVRILHWIIRWDSSSYSKQSHSMPGRTAIPSPIRSLAPNEDTRTNARLRSRWICGG
jgi:hypothetical protein